MTLVMNAAISLAPMAPHAMQPRETCVAEKKSVNQPDTQAIRRD